MESADLATLEKFISKDAELKALWDQHLDYERLLEKMEARPFNSPAQLQEIKELKKKKLAGKTKLQALLETYRQQEA